MSVLIDWLSSGSGNSGDESDDSEVEWLPSGSCKSGDESDDESEVESEVNSDVDLEPQRLREDYE